MLCAVVIAFAYGVAGGVAVSYAADADSEWVVTEVYGG